MDNLLEVRALSKSSYADFNITFAGGGIMRLIGPNGSGKTAACLKRKKPDSFLQQAYQGFVLSAKQGGQNHAPTPQ